MNIDAITAKISQLPINEQEAFFESLAEYEASLKREKAQEADHQYATAAYKV